MDWEQQESEVQFTSGPYVVDKLDWPQFGWGAIYNGDSVSIVLGRKDSLEEALLLCELHAFRMSK